MENERPGTSALPSVAVGVALGSVAVGLLIVWAVQPWLGGVLTALLGVVAFAGACLWLAYAGSMRRDPVAPAAPAAVWIERAVLLIVALGVIGLVGAGGRGFGSANVVVLLTVLGACAILGAAMERSPRALLAIEGAMCAGYVSLCGLIVAQSAGCWSCRDGDFTDGAYAIMTLAVVSTALVMLLGAVAAGASLRRRLR